MPEQNESPLPLLSRDLSWVDFNERVLDEGLNKDLPLLERLRFISIVTSNFDEFFMVRVAALKRALGANTTDPSGINPAQQLKEIARKAHDILKKQSDCMKYEIFPGLEKGGLKLLRPDSYSVPQMDYLESFFINQIYPVLAPLRMEEDRPMPFIESRAIHAAFLLIQENPQEPAENQSEEKSAEQIIIVQLPKVFSRIIWLPEQDDEKGKLCWALLDDVALTWGAYLFPGYRIKESMLFKINRDADFSVDEKRDEDFVEAMEEVLEGRGKSEVVRMVCSSGSVRIRDELARRFSLETDDLYEFDSPVNTIDFLELANVVGFEEMQEKPWKIQSAAAFSDETPIWDRIRQGDVMLHLPYQSFDPVIRFFEEAAADPEVVSIKTALYRTGGAIPGIGITSGSSSYSPVVRALEQAALNGKHVTAVVELKARFDEERNISWANRLEKAGVIVVYGLSRLKVHAKVTMIMRREFDRIKRYVHVSTGNYNYNTAKYYEDICLFT